MGNELIKMEKSRQAVYQSIIVALTIIAIAVVLILGQQRHDAHLRAERADFNQRQLIMARSIALSLESYLETIYQSLKVAATNQDLWEPYFCPDCFLQLTGQLSSTSLRLLDKNGTVRLVYPDRGWLAELVGQDYIDKAYFQGMLNGRENVNLSTILNEQNQLRIRVAVPVFLVNSKRDGEGEKYARDHYSQGGIRGMLIGFFDPASQIEKSAAPLLNGGNSDVWVLNSGGMILSHPIKENIGQDLFALLRRGESADRDEKGDQVYRSMIAGEEGVGYSIADWSSGHEGRGGDLVAYAPVRFQGKVVWSVAVIAPASTVDLFLRAVRDNEILTIIFVVLILLVSGAALFVATNRWTAILKREVQARTKDLQETRDYLDTLIRYANAPIVVLGIDGCITIFNRAFEKISGRTATEMVGGPLDVLFPAEKRGESLRKIEEAARESRWEFQDSVDIPILRPDGETRDCQWSFTKIYTVHNGGRPVATIAMVQDVTERVQAEEKIRRAKKEWERTFDAIPEVITILDPEMRILRTNKAVCEMFSVDPEELVGRYCYELFRKQDVPCEECPFDKTMNDRTAHSAEVSHPGLEKIFQVCITPLLDADGALLGAVHIAKDITAQKSLEAKLRQTQKMEAMGTLAGGIAHDFNNILTVILGYTDLVLSRCDEESDDYRQLMLVRTAGYRAKDLVQQILTFSRQGEAVKAPLSPAPIIKEVLKLLRSTLSSTIEIRQNVTSGQSIILADPTQIYQVLMNLCINASHAMEEEGGVLTVELRQKTLESTETVEHPTLQPGRYLEFRVSDTGHGIEPAVIGRIFEPFFTTKQEGKGTGMGLAVVHGVVMDHGGDITVHSQPGQGTTFCLLFPELDAVEGRDAVPDSAPLARGEERILIVDDEKILAQMLGRVLESFGYEVVVITSSVEALKLFSATPDFFDLVITDQAMPMMKGTKLAGKMRRIRADIPIILCTGYSDDVTVDSALALGVQEVLMKPVINSELAKVIRRVLDG